jgi:hypothetical protein
MTASSQRARKLLPPETPSAQILQARDEMPVRPPLPFFVIMLHAGLIGTLLVGLMICLQAVQNFVGHISTLWPALGVRRAQVLLSMQQV